MHEPVRHCIWVLFNTLDADIDGMSGSMEKIFGEGYPIWSGPVGNIKSFRNADREL